MKLSIHLDENDIKEAVRSCLSSQGYTKINPIDFSVQKKAHTGHHNDTTHTYRVSIEAHASFDHPLSKAMRSDAPDPEKRR